jgi:hypothetical protein
MRGVLQAASLPSLQPGILEESWKSPIKAPFIRTFDHYLSFDRNELDKING